MAHDQPTLVDEVTANEHATTTAFDVVHSRDILRQLAESSHRIYYMDATRTRAGWRRAALNWLREWIPAWMRGRKSVSVPERRSNQ